MADYTVSTSTTTESSGDNVNAGTMAAYVDLTITPNTGFVLNASEFSIGGATESPANTWTGGNVDPEVYKVVFSDIGTAGTLTNTVRARVHFDSTALGGTPWSMPSADKSVYIDIDTDTDKPTREYRPVCIRSRHHAEDNHTVTTTSETGITQSDDSATVGTPGTHEYFHQGTVPEGTPPGNLIFTKVFAASTALNYYYSVPPHYILASSSGYGDYSHYYTVVQSGETYDSDNNITGVTFKLYYNPPVAPTNPQGLDPDPFSTASAMCELNHYIQFLHSLRTDGEPGRVNSITKVLTDEENIVYSGESRNVKVVGNEDAEYTLTITNSGGDTYDFSSDTFTAAATKSDTQTLTSTGYIDHYIVYPAIAANDYYDVTIQAVPPSSVQTGVPVNTGDMRIYQYYLTVVTLGFSDPSNVWGEGTNSGDIFHTTNTAITLTGVAGTGGIRPETKAFSYTITPAMLDAGSGTITPKSGTGYPNFILAGTVEDKKVDGAPTSSTLTLDNTTDLLSGDTINWTTTKVTAFDHAAYTTEVFLYTSDSDPSPSTTDIVVGMKVSGNGVINDPTVVSTHDGFVILSSIQKIKKDVTLTFEASGITIDRINTTTELVASQDLTGVSDNLDLKVGGTAADSGFYIQDGTVTQATDTVANVIIAGTLTLTSYGTTSVTTTMNLDSLITIA